jgi:hypothetical protein
MAGGLVEATRELWAASLRDLKGRIRPLFRQQRMAHSAGLFLDALLGPERRKTGWMRAEAAGDPGPWRQRPCSVALSGTPMRFAMWCVTTWSRPWPSRMPCWWSMRRGS